MNQQQLEQCIEAYGEHLLKIAYFYVKNKATAEDIVQDVFLHFYTKNQYDERGQMRAYLTKLTANRCKDYLRSWSYKKLIYLNKESNSGADSRDELIVLEEKYQIGAAILKLPLKLREPIILYYYEELSVKEIADHLHMPLNTVKTHLRKGRERLKAELQSEQWEVLLDESMEA